MVNKKRLYQNASHISVIINVANLPFQTLYVDDCSHRYMLLIFFYVDEDKNE